MTEREIATAHACRRSAWGVSFVSTRSRLNSTSSDSEETAMVVSALGIGRP